MKVRWVLFVSALLLAGCEKEGQNQAVVCSSQPTSAQANLSSMKSFTYASEPGVQGLETSKTSLFNLLDTSLWPARWNCGIWTPEHGWLYIGSDVAIWLAYFAIPFILGFFYFRQKNEIPFRVVFLLFIGFIITCGLTHLMDAVIFWWPAYKLSAAIRFGTALVSWAAVIGLVKVMPEALELKGIDYYQEKIDTKTLELRKANEELEARINSEIKLKDINTKLLNKISAQNEELKKKNKSLEQLHELFESVQSAAEIGVWEVNLNSNRVYWSDAVYKIHEVEKGTPITVEQGINFYHPDYRGKIEKAIKSAINTGNGWDLNLQLITATGSVLWTKVIGLPVVENGKTVSLRGLFQDITDKVNREKRKESIKRSLEQKVVQRTIELESINKELNAFAYSVSHDLRSPLRSINGFSQALKEDYFEVLDETGKNYLQRISNAAIRMGKLIDELLDLSRLSRKDIQIEKVDLTALCQQIINETSPDPKYEFNIKKNLYLTGDLKLVKIMMENLIGNAIKYSSKIANPRIEIGKQKKNNKQLFFIRDNGAGFDQDYAGKLFGAFQRLHSAEEFEGTGIGLATVKRIINKHGGVIFSDSKVNEGATFYFNLIN
ncbi:MAG: ATP-binding protein [Fulvivirga sp.]|uniref:sensor histidine kinase n=1 Tax=Fulvivirga sp. TaxID=1931237 RepID=UPI0032F01916